MTNNLVAYILQLVESGWLSLLDYLAAHVILCLVPAFFIAGALSALIPKEIVTRYLGPKASKWVSYPAAAVGGFVLAVCSCTILPLFAGIWKRGAGLGPAITFLFVGPAINILAIAYTGVAIGMDIAIARILLSIVFGIVIGLIMSALFEDRQAVDTSDLFDKKAQIRPAAWAFFTLMVVRLIAGTLQIELLKQSYISIRIPLQFLPPLQAALNTIHLNLQGASIIVLLLITALAAFKGFEHVLEGINAWTLITLGLVMITLLVAAPGMSEAGGLDVQFTGRAIAVTTLLIALVITAQCGLTKDEIASWIWETWKFIKQIFPLLIVGVFAAGIVKVLIPKSWVQSLAGHNTIMANIVGVVFGVFMYFPTLVEVPIARMFLDLGMHRGPLLAYLIADPALSIQSILVTGKIMGRKKTAVYVVLVSVFSTLAGYIFGAILAIV